jgi:tRNA(Ile2) C34 agmatinyltransferase TiaS
LSETKKPTCPHCKGELEEYEFHPDTWLGEGCAILKCEKCGKKYDLTPRKEEPKSTVPAHYTYPEHQK